MTHHSEKIMCSFGSSSPSCPHTVYYYGKSSLSTAAPHPYIDADSIGDPTVPPIIPSSQRAGSIAVYSEPMVLDSIPLAPVPTFAPASREPALSSTAIQDDGEDKYSCHSNDTHLSTLDSDEKAPCKAYISSLACHIGLFPSFWTSWCSDFKNCRRKRAIIWPLIGTGKTPIESFEICIPDAPVILFLCRNICVENKTPTKKFPLTCTSI